MVFGFGLSRKDTDLSPKSLVSSPNSYAQPSMLQDVLNILHQDDDHAVVLKEAGMSTHGRGRQHLSALLARSPALPEGAKPVHRLDYGTRGPVLVAWSSGSDVSFSSPMAVYGQNLPQLVLELATSPIRRRCGFPIEGKPSRSTFRCLAPDVGPCTEAPRWWEWTIETGRTHQIRRHAAAMGHPVVGDLVYGTPPLYTGAGLHLTCTRLELSPPPHWESHSDSNSSAKK